MTSDLVETHKAWKVEAAAQLHRYADEQSFCTEFDRILKVNGLPMRAKYVCTPSCGCGMDQIEITGEATEEEFGAWRWRTSKSLHTEALCYGVRPGWKSVLRVAGFSVAETVQVKIKGTYTFEFDREIEVFGDAGYADAVDDRDVVVHLQAHLRDAPYDDSNLSWKVVKDDDNN